jgi:serine/threonine-protein kinase
MAPVAEPARPSTLKHYTLGREVGRGATGAVLEGIDRRDGSRVAVKILHSSLTFADPDFSERFEREAHLSALLRSPYTVPLLDYGIEGDWYFLVMEFIDGQSLAERLRAGPIAPADSLRIATEVARALEEAGARGVVHRDIKPENILLDGRGRARVADFGIARQAVVRGMTPAGMFAGTAAYAAPEQMGGEPDVRSDIYSLGATLYTMLAGRPPFEGRSIMELMVLHREAGIPMAPLEYLPDAVTNLIRRAMEKDPLDRYQNASELVGALERARRSLDRLGLNAAQPTPGPRPAQVLSSTPSGDVTRAASTPSTMPVAEPPQPDPKAMRTEEASAVIPPPARATPPSPAPDLDAATLAMAVGAPGARVAPPSLRSAPPPPPPPVVELEPAPTPPVPGPAVEAVVPAPPPAPVIEQPAAAPPPPPPTPVVAASSPPPVPAVEPLAVAPAPIRPLVLPPAAPSPGEDQTVAGTMPPAPPVSPPTIVAPPDHAPASSEQAARAGGGPNRRVLLMALGAVAVVGVGIGIALALSGGGGDDPPGGGGDDETGEPSRTASRSATATASRPASATASGSATGPATAGASGTPTPTGTPENTPTPTPTVGPGTPTPTQIRTSTPTATPSLAPVTTIPATATPTPTQVPPTATPTAASNAPATPTGVTASVSGNQMTVSWLHDGVNTTFYRVTGTSVVFRSGLLDHPVGSAERSATLSITRQATAQTVCVTVVASNASASSAGATACTTVPAS